MGTFVTLAATSASLDALAVMPPRPRVISTGVIGPVIGLSALLLLSHYSLFRHRTTALPRYTDAGSLREASSSSTLSVVWAKARKGWCTRSRQHSFLSPSGLLYVKVPKAASSTVASIVRRIVERNECKDYKNDHLPSARRYRRRARRSFLLGSVRDPSRRALSRVYWTQVTQQGQAPTDENVLKWLSRTTDGQYGATSKGQGGFQLNYLSMDAAEVSGLGFCFLLC